MVPQRSELPPCNTGQTRLLMAADDCYLETLTPWGHLVKLIMPNPRKVSLPYGRVEEIDSFTDVLTSRVMPIVTGHMLTEAARYAEEEKEWAGFVVLNGNSFIPWHDDFKATGGSVKFTTDTAANLPEGYSLVADIHSHGSIRPFFSPADNKSDLGKIKISVVLGNYRNEGTPKFDWKARFCVQGFFIEDEETLHEAFETLNLLHTTKRGIHDQTD